MKIAVFGAGAIGCYIGAALAHGGLDVTLIGRERMIGELNRAGQLRLTDYLGQETAVDLPALSCSEESLASADLIILTVKCLAMPAAATAIARYARPEVPILALQNGIGSEAELRPLPNPVISGIVGFNVAPLGQGRFHRGTEGDIYCAPCSRATQLQAALTPLNIVLQETSDFEAVRWAKLQLNLNNAINALSNLPLKQELETRGYRRVLSAAMTELIAVAQQRHLALPKLTRLPAHLLPVLIRVPDFLFRRLASSMLAIDPAARSSMWEDLHNARLTEVDFINGAVVKAGEALQIPTPVNQTLCELIHQLERGERAPGISAHDLLLEIKKRR